jgi:hypothetical protein
MKGVQFYSTRMNMKGVQFYSKIKVANNDKADKLISSRQVLTSDISVSEISGACENNPIEVKQYSCTQIPPAGAYCFTSFKAQEKTTPTFIIDVPSNYPTFASAKAKISETNAM